MRIASLGSGSKGNATLIEACDHFYLVDCGFGLKEVESRLRARGLEPDQLAGIFVTHEHGDHIKGAPMLANKYNIPLWATHGTARSMKRDVPTARVFTSNARLQLGELEVETVTVPHDSAEPSQFVFRASGASFGILTDLGSITNRVVSAYRECQVLMLECNHDPEMLQNGPYPPSLKRRVGGDYGHLSNEQAANLLRQINHESLNEVLISHISEQNNDPVIATDTVVEVVDRSECNVQLLTQEGGCDWVTIHQ